MKSRELQKPLVQSALVLLAVFLLIGFVAGSDSHTVLGGITSIFKGIFYTVLFVIALIISIVFTIAVLIAIFLAAVAIYSPQKSSDMYGKLRDDLTDLWASFRSRQITAGRPPRTQAVKPSSQPTASPTSAGGSSEVVASTMNQVDPLDDTRRELSAEIASVEKKVQDLHQNHAATSAAVDELQGKVKEIAVDEVTATAEMLAAKQDELSVGLTDCLTRLATISETVENNRITVQQQTEQLHTAEKKIAQLSSEIESLKTSMKDAETDKGQEDTTEEDLGEPRIFAYLENKEDRKNLTVLVDQALEEGKTYAEIDEFLTANLPKEVDGIIKDHPSLTKEFIRDRKNI